MPTIFEQLEQGLAGTDLSAQLGTLSDQDRQAVEKELAQLKKALADAKKRNGVPGASNPSHEGDGKGSDSHAGQPGQGQGSAPAPSGKRLRHEDPAPTPSSQPTPTDAGSSGEHGPDPTPDGSHGTGAAAHHLAGHTELVAEDVRDEVGTVVIRVAGVAVLTDCAYRLPQIAGELWRRDHAGVLRAEPIAHTSLHT